MKHFSFMVVFLMTCLLQQAVAQDKSVSGRVTDGANGSGVPGVTVLAKGTKIGTSTNADGQFTLSVPAATTTLEFRFVGYKTAERDITSSSTVEVALAVETRSLDEVVVTGLASNVKRSNLANSVATISAQELTGSTRQVTVDAALNGKIAGANISSNSGAPGGGVSVQLRGISTITGESQPLYVVDGVYVSNDQIGNGAGSSAFSGASGGTTRTTQDGGVNRISDLNPNDIESIEVLKGPSAAAIYGTRANAGVILIRTKRGAAGQTRVSLTQDVGFATASRLIGVEGWTPEKIDTFFPYPARASATQIAEVNDRRNEEKAALAAAQASGKIYDYEKEIYGNKGLLTATGVSISGGVEKTRFYVAASRTKENGIVKATDFQRNSIRANLDQKIGQRLDLSVSSNYINSSNRRGYFGNDNNGISVSYNLPYIPNYVELHKDPVTGLFPSSAPYTPENPLAVLERSINEEATNRFVQAATATVRIIDNENSSLRFAAQGGLDFGTTNATVFLPADLQSQRDLPNAGAIRLSRNNTFNTNLQGFLIYDWKLLDGNLNLTSQVGAVRLNNVARLSFSQGVGLVPGPPTPEVAAIQTQNSFQRRATDVGYIAQQEFNFRDRVIATAGIRFDKSSLNADVSKLYAFPKASLAVNVAKFDFWSLDKVNQFKLRAAYGQTGGLPGFGATFFPLVGLSTGGRNGYVQSTSVGNLSIAPETASELELGIDLGFLENKILLEASVYQKDVKDLINTFALAPGTGVTSIGFFPVGDLRNRGLELGLTATPLTTSNFVWNSTTQFWLNRTEVTRIAPKVPDFNPGSSFGSVFGRTFFTLGESPSRWYATPRVPVDANNKTGLTRYEEAQPKFTMSFLNSFTILKNFQASFLLVWRKDGYVSNLSRELSDEGGTTPDWSVDSGYRNPAAPGVVIPRGQGPRLFGTPANTGREFIQNAGFVRLREASLYYTIPMAVRTSLFKEYVSNIRVGVSGNNIFTATKYVGYDPEVSNFGNVANGAGVDVTAYPSSRRLFFHLGIDF